MRKKRKQRRATKRKTNSRTRSRTKSKTKSTAKKRRRKPPTKCCSNFPEEDDEELAALSAEDAAALIKKREEERKQREEKAEKLCAEGEALLEKAKAETAGTDGNGWKAAAEKFDAALVEIPCYTRAALGFWRAKTRYGEDLQPLYDEWAGYGYEDFAATFGEETAKILKEEWQAKIETEKTRLEEEIAPLKKDFEEKTEKRRAVLKERTYETRKKFIPALSVEIALLVFTVVFAANIFSRADAVFVWLTVAGGAAFVLALPFFCLAASKFSHAVSLSRAKRIEEFHGRGQNAGSA